MGDIPKHMQTDASFSSEDASFPTNGDDRLVLVGLETLGLTDGSKISTEIYTPVLGEALLNHLRDKLAPDDEVVVFGSAVTALAFGKYWVDVDTKEVPQVLFSDTDLYVNDASLMHKLSATLPQPGKSHTTIDLSGRKIQVINAADVMTKQAQAIDEALAFALHAGAQDAMLYSLQAYSLFRVETPTLEDWLGTNSLFWHESLGISVKKTSTGELDVTFLDPRDVYPAFSAQVTTSLDLQRDNYPDKQPFFDGFIEPDVNRDSSAWAILTLLSKAEGTYISESFAPAWAINPLLRMVRAECERGIIVSSGLTVSEVLEAGPLSILFDSKEYREIYSHWDSVLTMRDVAQRLMEGRLKVIVSEADGEKTDVKTWLRAKAQDTLALAAASDPYHAFCSMFVTLPFSEFISDDIAQDFAEVEDHLAPINFFGSLAYLINLSTNAQEISDRISKCKGLNTLLTMERLCREEYGSSIETVCGFDGTAFAPKNLQIGASATSPTGMSELMGMFLACSGWETEDVNTISKIKKLVDNWQPSGKIAHTWTKANVNFDKSLDADLIIDYINKFKHAYNL